jgi:hypothetical protein
MIEGARVRVPLGDERSAQCVVARSDPERELLVGYFYLDAGRGNRLSAESADWVAIFAGHEIESGNWPIEEHISDWDRHEWPMPTFGRHLEFLDLYQAVSYDDDDPSIELEAISVDRQTFDLLPEDGYAGPAYVVEVLCRLSGLPLQPPIEQGARDSSFRLWANFASEAAADRAAEALPRYVHVARESTMLVISCSDALEPPAIQRLEQLIEKLGGTVDGIERRI